MPTWWRYNPDTHIFEHSLNEGVSWAPPPLNASIINEGIIDEAHLPPSTIPPNIAFTNIANQFTLQQRISNADGDYPRLTLTNVNGALDKKVWQVLNFADVLNFWAMFDDESGAEGTITFDRTSVISANGLKFPSTYINATDPNTLDDYEEGSFTPFFGAISGNYINAVYNPQVGRYVKVGNVVKCWFNLTMTVAGTGGSGYCILLGLPFYNGNTYGGGVVMAFGNLNTSVYNLNMQINPDLYYSYFNIMTSISTANTALNITGIKVGTAMYGFFQYRIPD